MAPPELRDLLVTEGAVVFSSEMLATVAPALADLEALADDFALVAEPPSFDDRIVNQYALFTLMSRPDASLDEWLDERPELVRRVVIPAELKWEVRDKLDQSNVSERVLFPGLDGLTRTLTRHYAPHR